MTKESLEALYESLIEFSMTQPYLKAIKNAESIYSKSDYDDDSLGFMEWFIFNYPINKNKTCIVHEFDAQNTSQELLLGTSYRSFFSILRDNQKMFLTDLVTKRIYEMSETLIASEGVVCARLIEHKGLFYTIGDEFYFDSDYADTLIKLLSDAYNQFVQNHEPMPFEMFISEQSQYVFKLVSTIESVEFESSDEEEEYQLYQATYLCKFSKLDTIHWLKSIGLPIISDDDLDLFTVIIDDVVVAEIEWVDQRMYFQCNNAIHLEQMIKLMNDNPNESIHFFSTEVLSLDDLLNQ